MAKRKVIEDSDDEDLDSPSPEKAIKGLERKTSPALENEGSVASEEPQRSVVQSMSTASTGEIYDSSVYNSRTVRRLSSYRDHGPRNSKCPQSSDRAYS